MFMTVKQAAEKWGISDRRVRTLCAEDRIPGAYRSGRSWVIPADAVKPADGRYHSTESLLSQIDQKKKLLDQCRPLTEGELERLREEFIVEYTYNSVILLLIGVPVAKVMPFPPVISSRY